MIAYQHPEEENVTALLEASPVPIAIYRDKEIIISSVNQAMLDLWGKDKSLIGKPFQEALPELNDQPFFNLLQNVYNTGELYESKEEYAPLMRDGKMVPYYFNFTYKALKNAEGIITGILHTATDVTELVLARKQIAETSDHLTLALSSAEIGIWGLDLINKTVTLDAQSRMLLGYEEDQSIPYETALDYIHADDKDQVNAKILTSMDAANGGHYEMRYRSLHKQTQAIRWIHSKGRVYFNQDGIAYRIAGIIRDITQEVKNSRREQQLLSLVSNNADLMSITDIRGQVLYMNKAGRELLGIDQAADITKFRAEQFYTKDELFRIQNLIKEKEFLQNGWSGIVHVMHLKTRETIPCQVNYLFIQDVETGEIIGRGATARDMRNELKAGKALADKNMALQNAVKEWEFLADTVPSIVWTSRPDGELDYINKRWSEAIPQTAEDVVAFGWNDFLHPDDVHRVKSAWQHSFGTGDPYEVEFRCLDKQGNYRWFLVRGAPLRNEEGRIIKWYGTNTDVQVQKEMENQKDNFLGVASHELKTPVTSIKAYAQVMESMFQKSGDWRNAELVAKMDKQINRLNVLIDDLLDVTKINTGRLQFNLASFDFNQMIEEVTEEVQHSSLKHLIRKQLKFKRLIVGDRDRISQVVVNLLTNAIKYSPEANEIIIYTEDLGNEVRLCIQDFGIGISSDKQDKVFEQFYRVSGTREHTFPGLGLGLYISSEIVKRLGGKIWVNSVEGKGSIFCFSLPVEQVTNVRE